MDTYTNDVIQMKMSNLSHMPRLLQGMLIQTQAMKVQNSVTVERMSDIIDSSDVLMYMLSLIPATLLVYGSYSGMKRIYRGQSLDMHTYKYRFRRLILKLHSLFLGLKDPSSR